MVSYILVFIIINIFIQSQFGGSRQSQRSRKGDSYVDETLFGGKKAGSKAGANTAVVSLDELRTIRGNTASNK